MKVNRKLVVVVLATLLSLTLLILLLAPSAASSASGAPQAPAIVLTQTVGTNPALCATTKSITLGVAGGAAIPCYTIRNVGNVTLTRHTLVDSHLGSILNDFPYMLVPGASAFITQSVVITHTRVSTGTWTANNPGPTDQVSASSAITVHVPPRQPAISLEQTVGLNPAVCATEERLALPPSGGEVVFCYRVVNSGNISLTRHTLVDSHLGTILNNFPYTLVPGASAFLTQTATITHTTVSTGTWTAYNPGPSDEATASGATHVIVAYWNHLPFWRK